MLSSGMLIVHIAYLLGSRLLLRRNIMDSCSASFGVAIVRELVCPGCFLFVILSCKVLAPFKLNAWNRNFAIVAI